MTSERKASARVGRCKGYCQISDPFPTGKQVLLGLTKIKRTLRGFLQAGSNLTHWFRQTFRAVATDNLSVDVSMFRPRNEKRCRWRP
jgi:hypothetical protein